MDPDYLLVLAEGLSDVARRLEAKRAVAVSASAAAAIVQAMSKTTDPNVLRAQAEGLSAALSRVSTVALSQRFLSVAGTVGGRTGTGSMLTTPAVLQIALEPLPPPLPAQVLVDLLKHPCCVGNARGAEVDRRPSSVGRILWPAQAVNEPRPFPRRIVLDQLQRHYNRVFADQWDFVRFATEQRLDLDLARPPKGPEDLATSR
jgi:hypothetical protein